MQPDVPGATWLAWTSARAPDEAALAGLARLDEPLPELAGDAGATLALPGGAGSPALTTVGPMHYGVRGHVSARDVAIGVGVAEAVQRYCIVA